MKIIIKLIGYITISAAVLILLDLFPYEVTYISLWLWIIIFASWFFIKNKVIAREILWLGGLFYVCFFVYICNAKIRVNNIDKRTVTILSPLGTRTLAQGSRVDSVSLRSGINSFYNTLSAKREDFYFVYNEDSVHIFNHYHEVVSADKDLLSICHRSYKGVEIDLFKIGECYYSLDGKVVDDNWRCPITDITPIDPNM